MVNLFNIKKVMMAVVVWASTYAAFAAPDGWQMNMSPGVTPISKEIYDLHMIAMLICAVIGIIVFGVMFYALFHHRKSKGYVPATFHDNTRVEIIWTIIPFIILVGLAIPATQVLMRMEDSSDAAVTIKVVGYQWKWQYQYLDQGISYFSNLSTPYAEIRGDKAKNQWYLLEVDKPLVVPVNKKIRFLVTSNDVIHSWWVPEIGVKRDAIPGFMHESWALIKRPGVYRGQCAELCGVNHGFMPIVVRAVSEEDFAKWVAAEEHVVDIYAAMPAVVAAPKPISRAALMHLGKKKYEEACAACHQANGRGIPPLYPALKNSSVAVGFPISRHIELILQGIPGTAMQPYNSQLTDAEIAAIVTYERNAWGNNTDDIIQAGDVALVRQSLIKKPDLVEKAQVGGLQ